MDLDDLSDEVYKATILAAEKFNYDLALYFVSLASQCRDKEDYLLQAEQFIDEFLNDEDFEILIDDMFFGNPVDPKDLKKVLLKIKSNVNKIIENPTENLNKEDIALFFKLWYMLIYSINCKHKIVPAFKRPIYGNDVKQEPFLIIKKALWENPSLIDEFLIEDGARLSDEEKAILTSWRANFIYGDFIILKYLKKYSVFMPSSDTQKLYGVIGISDPIEMVIRCSLPCIVKTTLLPFKGKIIYDSSFQRYSLSFGAGSQKTFMESYKQIKAKNGIIESFPL
ncbi:MAG: hypothetical protein LBC85_03915 [Fibromonadaceae bacterium]|jgi:hypothetical protein|nr:hypothetical protein [Fibromonadaceae bacterium]